MRRLLIILATLFYAIAIVNAQYVKDIEYTYDKQIPSFMKVSKSANVQNRKSKSIILFALFALLNWGLTGCSEEGVEDIGVFGTWELVKGDQFPIKSGMVSAHFSKNGKLEVANNFENKKKPCLGIIGLNPPGIIDTP